MTRRIQKIVISLLGLSTAATILLLWGTEIPLGVPGEWTWKRIRIPSDATLTFLLSGAIVAIFGAIYLAVAWFGSLRIAAAPRGERILWLLGLSVAGFAWQCAVQESPAPPENQWGKSVWVTYYRGSSGYYDEARYAMNDASAYLSGYEQKMTEGDFLHFGTHPPGLALFHRATIVACESSPALTRLLLSTQPGSVDEAFQTIEENNRGGPKEIQQIDRAAVWLGVLLIQAISVATVIPLYSLASRSCSKPAAWKASSFWPAVPALAVFLPVSDALYPFVGTSFLAVWMSGWSTRSPLRCMLAGLVIWLGMFLSLALLPVALLAALITFAEAWRGSPNDSKKIAFGNLIGPTFQCVGWSLIGFVIPIILVWFIGRANLVAIWLWNLRNHEGFYTHNTRTYWKWFFVNPLELAFGVGWPIVVLAVAAGVQAWRQRRVDARWLHFACCFGVWACLWLSGKNMGEAARLWLVVMPWPVWLIAGLLDASETSPAGLRQRQAGGDHRMSQRLWVIVLIAQMAVCVATSTRVNGFDFGL